MTPLKENLKKQESLFWTYMDAIGKFVGKNWKAISFFAIVVILMFAPTFQITNLMIDLKDNDLTIMPTENKTPAFSYFLLRGTKTNNIDENQVLLTIQFYDNKGNIKYQTQKQMPDNKTLVFYIAESFNVGEQITVITDDNRSATVNLGRS